MGVPKEPDGEPCTDIEEGARLTNYERNSAALIDPCARSLLRSGPCLGPGGLQVFSLMRGQYRGLYGSGSGQSRSVCFRYGEASESRLVLRADQVGDDPSYLVLIVFHEPCADDDFLTVFQLAVRC